MTEQKKEVQTACKKGSHSFIVTRWLSKGGSEKAVQMRCQKCLEPVGIEELEMLEFKQENGMS